MTISCPFECEFLQEARRREKPNDFDPATAPNKDIRISEEFLENNEALLTFVAQAIAVSALQTSGVVDSDVREALDGLTRTYRTLQSGVYYESIPANPLAVAVYAAVQEAVQRFRDEEKRDSGLSRTRDADVLGLLVFLQRLELDRNNGRRRGRAFIDFLHNYAPSPGPPGNTQSSLILP